MPYIKRGEATLFVNVGDHEDVWKGMVKEVAALGQMAQCHFNDFASVAELASEAAGPDGNVTGIHAFCDKDIFSAVYSSNLLMRVSDVLVTKPSEFSFYPVPKLMIHRICLFGGQRPEERALDRISRYAVCFCEQVHARCEISCRDAILFPVGKSRRNRLHFLLQVAVHILGIIGQMSLPYSLFPTHLTQRSWFGKAS